MLAPSTIAAWSILMPLGAFLASLLVLIPLPSHWKARNVPTLSIIGWLFVVNIARGVNTIVWANDAIIRLVVWCDIVTRIDVAASVALPAACFCLCMNLERVSRLSTISLSSLDKRRRTLIDCAICIGIPIVYISLFYIVQGHRFDIVEGFGCRAEDYVSIPEFFLVWFPPVVFAIGTFVFAGLAFVHFLRRRITFAAHLESASAGLTPARYIRLMAMSITQMFWSLLVISATIWFNYRAGLRPWTNWADVHSNWSRIGQYLRFYMPDSDLRWSYVLWWTTPLSAYLFVAFFAFGTDALNGYRSVFLWIRRVVFRRKSAPQTTQSSFYSYTSAPSQKAVLVNISQSTSYSSPTASDLAVKVDLERGDQLFASSSSPPSYHEQLHRPFAPR